MSETEHGAQVVTVTDDHKYILGEEELKRMLLRDNIKELPVVVISVAGPYRGGKSFLLNFFLRYLKSPISARADGSWLAENSKRLEGFSWRGGAKRNTTGILMWSEPIVVTLASGEEVVVLLMDTQGTFDSTSTVRDCSTIFALSTLLSSVQIYNVSHNIQEDHLQHLQLFTEYGRLIKNSSGKAFQVLEFLVRDWQFPTDFPYGAEGGEGLLADRLKIDPNMAKELKDLRTHIRSCFDKVSCYLMPHPGFEVLEPTFKGDIDEISVKFRKHLILLVSSIFGPEKLQPKLVNGERVKARELFTYFKSYLNLFNSDEIPTPTSIMKATAEAGLLTAYLEGLAQYVENMTRECGEKELCVPPEDIKVLHDRYKALARSVFVNKKKMGDQADADQYLEKLTKEIESRAKEFTLINMAKQQKTAELAKEAYDADIAKVSNGQPFCVHSADLANIHDTALKAAMKVFDSARKRITTKPDEERNRFKQSLEKKFDLLKRDNDKNNIQAIGDVRYEYWEYMETKSSVDPPLNTTELDKEHKLALVKVLESFKKKRNRPDSYNQDFYKNKLTNAIEERYKQVKSINNAKNKKAMTAALREYNIFIGNAWNQKTQCLHPDDLQKEQAAAVCKALEVFRPRKTCSVGFDTSDEDEKTLQTILKDRYVELLDANVAGNNAAVQSALNVYKESLEERESPSWWWLTVIPMIINATKRVTLTYHAEAKEDALVEFYKHRRNRGNEDTDIYRLQLLQIIDSSSSWYTFLKNVAEFITRSSQGNFSLI